MTSTVDVLEVLAPMAGRVLRLAEVPDPVFAEAMVGPGTAIDPPGTAATAVPPVAGPVATPDRLGVLRDAGDVRAGEVLFRWT